MLKSLSILVALILMTVSMEGFAASQKKKAPKKAKAQQSRKYSAAKKKTKSPMKAKTKNKTKKKVSSEDNHAEEA